MKSRLLVFWAFLLIFGFVALVFIRLKQVPAGDGGTQIDNVRGAYAEPSEPIERASTPITLIGVEPMSGSTVTSIVNPGAMDLYPLRSKLRGSSVEITEYTVQGKKASEVTVYYIDKLKKAGFKMGQPADGVIPFSSKEDEFVIKVTQVGSDVSLIIAHGK